MRDIKELLELLVDYIEKEDEDDFCGMCMSTNMMKDNHIISSEEEECIDKYIYENKPSDSLSGWWWPVENNLQPKEPRLKFINELITKLNEKN